MSDESQRTREDSGLHSYTKSRQREREEGGGGGGGHRRATREGGRCRTEVRAPPRCARAAALSVSGDREKEGGRGREATRGERERRGGDIFTGVL